MKSRTQSLRSVGHFEFLLSLALPGSIVTSARSAEIDVYAVGKAPPDVRLVKREVGTQTLKFSNISLTKALKGATPFLLAGSRLYEYGAMDGTFPAASGPQDAARPSAQPAPAGEDPLPARCRCAGRCAAP